MDSSISYYAPVIVCSWNSLTWIAVLIYYYYYYYYYYYENEY
jgi:hypothetical protein